MHKTITLLALALAAVFLAACSHAASSHPAAKASVKAEASALAGQPAAAQLRADLQACIAQHANPLHPARSLREVEACVQADMPNAHVATLTQCGLRVYFADRGDPAKENAGYNGCVEAAQK